MKLKYRNRKIDYRCTRIATHLRKCIRGSIIQPKTMIQVGVWNTFEAIFMKEWFPSMRIIGTDPVEREMFYPGELHGFAVSDVDESVGFHDRAKLKTSFVSGAKGGGGVARSVQGIKLDTLASECNVDGPVVLWMDCEGSEGKAIEGGADILSRTDWIYMECDDVTDYKKWHAESNQARLIEMGFQIYSWPNSIMFGRKWRYRMDVIFVRPEILTAVERKSLEVRREARHLRGKGRIILGHILKEPEGEEVLCGARRRVGRTFKDEEAAFSPDHNELVCGDCLVEMRKGLVVHGEC